MLPIALQTGPQTDFLATPADIAIYGGAAGGGKSWALLCEGLRHRANRDFSAVIFRRNAVQVRNPGGLWDEAMRLYPLFQASPRQQLLDWRFPSGARVKFSHLERESDMLTWQGAQIPLICFDELTHFSRAQFFYLLSRNRSTCGVAPYIRATCNPDADSWVAEFISWWIDEDSGLAIPARSSALRWMIRLGDSLVWADSREALIAAHGEDCAALLGFSEKAGAVISAGLNALTVPAQMEAIRAKNENWFSFSPLWEASSDEHNAFGAWVNANYGWHYAGWTTNANTPAQTSAADPASAQKSADHDHASMTFGEARHAAFLMGSIASVAWLRIRGAHHRPRAGRHRPCRIHQARLLGGKRRAGDSRAARLLPQLKPVQRLLYRRLSQPSAGNLAGAHARQSRHPARPGKSHR